MFLSHLSKSCGRLHAYTVYSSSSFSTLSLGRSERLNRLTVNPGKLSRNEENNNAQKGNSSENFATKAADSSSISDSGAIMMSIPQNTNFQLTPTQIVKELDKYVIGQEDAKKSVAIAMRARWRRFNLPGDFRSEVHPTNLLLMGPTGSGKTEIARRVAKQSGSPFTKVEATRYTEVGVVGANTDSMVKDQVEVSFKMEKERAQLEVMGQAHKDAVSAVTGVLKLFTEEQWDKATDKKWREWVEEDIAAGLETPSKSSVAEESAEDDVIDFSSTRSAGKGRVRDVKSGLKKKSNNKPSRRSSKEPEEVNFIVNNDGSISLEELNDLKASLANVLRNGGELAPGSDPVDVSGPTFVDVQGDTDAFVEQYSRSKVSYNQAKRWVEDGRLNQVVVNVDLPVNEPESPMTPLNLEDPGDGPIFAAFPLFPTGKKPKKTKRESVTVEKALKALAEAESEKLLDLTVLKARAVKSAEETGIIFIDEIDKLCRSSEFRVDGFSSNKGEGVQKDLLSLIEGTVVNTPKGTVKTDNILFITSGAFYRSKPNDLLPELQGRLPIRVALKPLTEAEFERVLLEPEYSVLKQQQELMRSEDVQLSFTPDAVREIARVSALLNHSVENIGARRLSSVVAQVLHKLNFNAPDMLEAARATDAGSIEYENKTYVVTRDNGVMLHVFVTKEDVTSSVESLLKKTDLSKFTL